jgi:small subunit ribosomal protein S4e
MGKKGGDTRVKRQMSPNFWTIKRKESQFVMKVRPGPHPNRRAYPLGMVLRDLLKLADTAREADRILKQGDVKVDGIVRRDSNYSIGLMDVLELSNRQAYRMIPKDSTLLAPVAIEGPEKAMKPVKVTSKTIIKENKIQYGFHDSKTIISNEKLRVGDTCIIDLPEVRIRNNIAFESGSKALVITGENAGRVGTIDDIKDGIFSLPKRALVTFDDKAVELPVEMVMVIGVERPVIKVS